MTANDRLPSMLTVEEAASFMRIGRTKAYALAQEWRATGGQSGLPVVDFGHVLRVPRGQLEAMIGGPLDIANSDATIERSTPRDEAPASAVVEPEVVESEAVEVAVVEPAAVEPAAPTRTPGKRTRRATTNDHRDTNTQLSFSELDLND